MPHLFEPLTVRGITLRNRIGVSPMCMYSAQDGVANDFHLVHLGRFAMGGAGLVFAEATSVNAQGRITAGCLGLWNDTQAVLSRHPDEPRALSYQALVRVEMGQPEIALEMLKKALAKAPDMAEIHVHLMMVYARMGRLADAEAAHADAVKRFQQENWDGDKNVVLIRLDVAVELSGGIRDDDSKTFIRAIRRERVEIRPA